MANQIKSGSVDNAYNTLSAQIANRSVIKVGKNIVNNNTSEITYTIKKSDFNDGAVGSYLIVSQEWATTGKTNVDIVTYSGNNTQYSTLSSILNGIGSATVTLNAQTSTFNVKGSHIVYALN